MTQRNSLPLKKSARLFVAALLTGCLMSSFAAETEVTTTGDNKVIENAPDANPLNLDDGKSSETVMENAPPANPLSFDNGKIIFDVQERLRWENRSNNFDFNSAVRSPTDGNWFEQRFRFGVAVKPIEWLTIYAQGQSALEIDGHRGTIPGMNAAEGDDYFNLRQGYIQIANYDECPWGFKIGRQVLDYGDQRLVGEQDWVNYSRTFDAAKLTYQGHGFWVDAFTSTPVVISRGQFDQSDLFNGTGTDRKLVFSGLYLSIDPLPFGTWDFYTFMLDQSRGNTASAEGLLNAPVTTGSLEDRSDFATFGTRIKGDPNKLNGWEYSGEFAGQAGVLRGEWFSAAAVSAGAGYNFLDAAWRPRLWLEYNYASGNHDPDGDHINTFQNLFPTNHPLYGIMDAVAWQNTDNLLVSARVSPLKNVSAKLDYRAYWLATTNDDWYRANGFTAVRPLSAAAGRDVSNYTGSELDFVLTWDVTKNLQWQGGYSHFFAGAYLKDTGAHDDANFYYLQALITF